MSNEIDYRSPIARLEAGAQLHGFTVERAEPLPERGGYAYIMRHDATGARLMWLACDDNNKSFAIGFKTPPADDTGTFHILEHSVLCGSERYPVKEPFVNLLKTSMQTFLNAITFSDKTLYPVASTNDQDLDNLMDVYLDAVLAPAIYQRPRIFEQEGWHLEVDEQGTLTRNGVVYNEMKGALSDPDDVLMMWLNRSLFPDTAYGFESGGDPQYIPTLSYEMFLDNHKRHYRLDNSYTIIYGAVDLDRVLAHIDDRFTHAERREAGAPNPLELQAPVCADHVVREMATAPENAAVGLGYVFATSHERTRVLAMDVLIDALLGSNEAPLKRAILESGLGADVVGYLVDGIAQPLVFIELKGASDGVADQFRALVEDVCARLVREGIGEDNLESSIAQMEFMLRESDMGMSDGVNLSAIALAGWLYDDADATLYLRYEDALAELKQMAADGGFERLLDEAICHSAHRACVTLKPVSSTSAEAEAAELAELAEQIGEEGLAAVAEETAALREMQETPDAPEDLAKLPQLHVSDIGPAPEEPQPLPQEGNVVDCVLHDLPTHGIDYTWLSFPLDGVAFDELPYVSILALLLGKLDTSEHDAYTLDTLLERWLGSFDCFCETYHVFGSDACRPTFLVAASALSSNVDKLAALPQEVYSSTQFSDHERIRDILEQRRIELEQSMTGSGHSWALSRLSSYTQRASLVAEQTQGVDYYRFLRALLDDFDARADALSAKLGELARRIFVAPGAKLSFAGSADDLAAFWREAGDLSLPAQADTTPRLEIPEPQVKNEAFVVPANVCFVAQGAPTDDDMHISGAWLVASRALSYDYLWNEIRVKGGAYGCGFRSTTDAQLQYYTYRDPAVDPSVARIAQGAAWLGAWDPTADEMEGYIVSNVATRDAPLKPRALARRQDVQHASGITPAFRRQLRDEIIAATSEQIRALSEPLAEATGRFATCVFGGRDQIAASDADLSVVELFGSGAQS